MDKRNLSRFQGVFIEIEAAEERLATAAKLLFELAQSCQQGYQWCQEFKFNLANAIEENKTVMPTEEELRKEMADVLTPQANDN